MDTVLEVRWVAPKVGVLIGREIDHMILRQPGGKGGARITGKGAGFRQLDALERRWNYIHDWNICSMKFRDKCFEALHRGFIAIIRRRQVEVEPQSSPRLLLARRCEVETIEVHHLVPDSGEVVGKFLVGVRTSVDFRQCAEL